MKTVIVLGATGLVGGEIVSLLEADPAVEKVVLLVRRTPDRPVAAKTEVRITDFRRPESYAGTLEGDALFSALGTTRKIAGSKDAQYEVDYTFQYEVARAAKACGVAAYGLVSSLGANAGSSMFYTQMKGKLDRDVAALGFARTRIVRPSLLVGARATKRLGEGISEHVLGGLSFLPFVKKMRPIPARTVAAALVALVADPSPGVMIRDSADLFALAGVSPSP